MTINTDQFVPFTPGHYIRDGAFLLLICLAGFGIYFTYDLPAAVGVDIKLVTNMTQADFMFTFYSLYSLPSAFSAIFSGVLIDNIFGLGLGGVVFAILGVIAQLAIVAGFVSGNYWLLGAGRFLQGTASEPLGVVRATYNAKYFANALHYGLVLAASRCGSVGGFMLIPPALCWAYPNSPSCVSDASIDTPTLENTTSAISKDPLFDKVNYALQVCTIIGTAVTMLAAIAMFFLMRIDKHFDREVGANKRRQATKSEGLKFSDIKQFPIGAWLLILVFMFFYSSIFPFNSMLPDYCKDHLKFSKEQASMLSSVVYLLSVIGAPTFGQLIDTTKRHPIWTFVACLTLGLSQAAWGWIVQATDPADYAGLYWTLFSLNFVNGICYSVIASCVMPWLGKMMPMNLKATAFGLLFGIQQIGVGSISSFLGKGVDQLGWVYFPYLCGSVAFISAAVTLILFFTEGLNPWDSYDFEEDDGEPEDITVSRRSFVS